MVFKLVRYSTGTSSSKGGVIVTEWARCQMGRVTVAARYCSTAAHYSFSPILRVEVNPAQLKYQAQGS